MHEIPDTEEADADAERLQPEEYKQIIRNRLKHLYISKVLEQKAFKSFYEQHYQEQYSSYEKFVWRLSEMVVIGAENGADEMFAEVYDSFYRQIPLPEIRACASYFQPEAVNQEIKRELSQKIIEEYSSLHAYEHIYHDHFQGSLSYDAFIELIAKLIVTGVANGSDQALGKIFRAFLYNSPLPLLRRYTRRTQ